MNKAILIGNLTRDPELRTLPSGVSVCNFSIAVNRKFTNAQGQRETDFFNIAAWRGLGENCAKYLAKGRKVCVTGQITTRSYDAQDGSKRTVVEIQADDVEFLSQAGESHSGDGYSAQPSAQSYSAPQASTPVAPPPAFNAANGFTQVDDDELPF